MTPPKLISARLAGEHRLWLSYDDGRQGEVDLSGELTGFVFEPLRDQEFFKQFTLDPVFHTLQWPKGADFAPEFLLRKLDEARVTAKRTGPDEPR